MFPKYTSVGTSQVQSRIPHMCISHALCTYVYVCVYMYAWVTWCSKDKE